MYAVQCMYFNYLRYFTPSVTEQGITSFNQLKGILSQEPVFLLANCLACLSDLIPCCLSWHCFVASLFTSFYPSVSCSIFHTNVVNDAAAVSGVIHDECWPEYAQDKALTVVHLSERGANFIQRKLSTARTVAGVEVRSNTIVPPAPRETIKNLGRVSAPTLLLCLFTWVRERQASNQIVTCVKLSAAILNGIEISSTHQ